MTNNSARAFAVNGTNLFAGTGCGVFRFTGYGWTASSTGMGCAYVRSLAVSGVNLFAGTDRGVFISTNDGAIWTAVNTGLPHTDVTALAVSGTNLFAGIAGAGVWRRPLLEMTSVRLPSGELPAQFSLNQNYPNPFNPSTTINFELPRTSDVRLSVFDLLGRQVSVLVNERRDAGVHEVKFGGSNVAGGVYFYRLQAGDFVQTKKLVFLK